MSILTKLIILATVILIIIQTVSTNKLEKKNSFQIIKDYTSEDIKMMKQFVIYQSKHSKCKLYDFEITKGHNYTINTKFKYNMKDYDCAEKLNETIKKIILSFR